MNICGSLIKTDDIIGISILQSLENLNSSDYQLYGLLHLFFDIFTKHGKVEIKSGRIYMNPDTEDDKNHNMAKYKEFEDGYYDARKRIAVLINEPLGEQNRFDEKIKDKP
jgi:hypothetical protein